MRVPQQPNPSLYLPHPKIHLLSPLPNHEHRRKKKFNLQSSLPHSRMTLLKTLEIPRIILGMRSLQHHCVLTRLSMKFSTTQP
uniref:Uncharacterized protein n=1 Tax=Setaria italica TaxID=4555 RepID=K3Y1Y4_SETIT